MSDIWKYTESTKVMIDDEIFDVIFYPGCTSIGTRSFRINGVIFDHNAYIYSDEFEYNKDSKKINHSIYLANWKDSPEDKIYVFLDKNYEKRIIENLSIKCNSMDFERVSLKKTMR